MSTTLYTLAQITIDAATRHPTGTLVEVQLICRVGEPAPLTGHPTLMVEDWAGPVAFDSARAPALPAVLATGEDGTKWVIRDGQAWTAVSV